MPKDKMPRVQTSLRGAVNIGPTARPSTYRLKPNVPIVSPTPHNSCIFFCAGEYPEAAQLTLKSIKVIAATIDHYHITRQLLFALALSRLGLTFRHTGQFRGLAGSPGVNLASPLGSETEEDEWQDCAELPYKRWGLGILSRRGEETPRVRLGIGEAVGVRSERVDRFVGILPIGGEMSARGEDIARRRFGVDDCAELGSRESIISSQGEGAGTLFLRSRKGVGIMQCTEVQMRPENTTGCKHPRTCQFEGMGV